MEIEINGEKKNITRDSCLEDILSDLGIKSLNGMAVAVNNEVISKTHLNDYIPKEGDDIIIIRSVQGG
jgi:sulfur carrier protein